MLQATALACGNLAWLSSALKAHPGQPGPIVAYPHSLGGGEQWVSFKVSFTPARSFRPFPPLSKVPFLGKRKPRQQWGGCCAPGTLWPCATERAGSGQPTQCAHRSCRETRAVAGNCAKAAQAGFPHQGQTRPRKRRRIFGRRATNIQCHPRQQALHILKGIVLEGPTHVSVLF